MRIGRFTQVLAGLFLGIGIAIPVTAQKSSLSGDGAEAQTVLPHVRDRIVDLVDDARLVKLAGNVHPLARAESDMGRVDSNKLLERVVMVLKRSPEQEAALAAFNERQYDPKSPDFHHWLTAGEFGNLYGPSDADLAAVTNWLLDHRMQIDEVGKGRVYVQFTGTVGDVERAFHVEMHNYLAEGKMHLANDRDPQIPAALSPVVTGLASLHDFFPKHFSRPGNFVQRDLKTGKYTVLPPDPPANGGAMEPTPTLPGGTLPVGSNSYTGKTTSGVVQPDLGWVDPTTGYQREDLTPYDLAAIYNILPLWNAATPINGTGVKVAIVAQSDVVASDLNTYRSSFGLPATTLTTLHSGADPGLDPNNQLENTEDVEMVSATAPGASIVLVADPNTATSDGLITAILYIVNNSVAPILTMSYGACELKLGTAGNTLWNQTFQQAATAGISSFVSAGDSGSATCTSQNGAPPYGDLYGLAVSGMASSPYVTAVGGTDLQWPFVAATHPFSTYWNTTADAHGATAKGYMPEMSWNATCSNPILLNVYTSYTNVEALCNAAITALSPLVEMASGGGGVSNCTTNSTTTSTTFDPTSCSGGYAKPSWQTGVAGIPADGKRDVPDISMFASYGFGQLDNTGIPGTALLICEASATHPCNYATPGTIVYQENGGTSAASPMTAGIMALVVQKVGTAQGLANPVLYSLAGKENYAACDSNTVTAGNSCVFYDTTTGTNAMNCKVGGPNCVTNVAGDQAGILSGYSATAGYDLTTGLGSINVANLVNAWPAPVTTLTAAPSFSLAGGTYHSPQSLTLTDATPGASIYYTYAAGGTTPTTASTLYTVPITVSSTGTVEAIAVAPGFAQSHISAKAYVYVPQSPAAAPAFNLAGGTYHSPQTLVLTDATPGATIYYTTNGTLPTTSSTVYSAPIAIASTELVEAAAIATGFTLSPISSKAYTYVPLPTAAAPAFSLPGGTYNTPQMLTLTDATPGATIYYTTNGTAATASSTKYTAPITIASTELVEAVAIATGYNPSPLSSKAYTYSSLPKATAPAFSLAGGHYTTPQMLTLTDATPGAVIYYTTNGTTPTASSTRYVGAITVSTAETVEAIAVATGYANSGVSAKAYTIP